MGANDGEECGSVTVPVSLIAMLTETLLDTIDHWHEERGIRDLNLSQCIVAMMAATDAAAEALIEYPDGATIQ